MFVDEYKGQTFYISYSSPLAPNICFKIDLSTTGSISIDHNGIDCTSNNPFTSSMKIGAYSSHTESAIYFQNDGVEGNSTKLVIKASPSVNGSEIGKFEYYQDTNSFLVELLMPSCTAPSMMPSSSPTLIPTRVETQMPSISSKPSFQPSLSPSTSPTCFVDDLIGHSLYIPYNNDDPYARYCVKIDITKNGVLAMDYSNPGCNNPVFIQSLVLGVYDNHLGNKILFKQGPTGWSGHIEVAENPLVQGYTANILTFDPACKSFVIALFLPICKSPSTMPSSTPSSLPTNIASMIPSISSLPSIMPSAEPTTSTPTITPTCSIDDLIGKTYFTPITMLFVLHMCIKVELFENGIVAVDNNNPDCGNNSFKQTGTLGIFDRSKSSGLKAIYSPAPKSNGWSSVVTIMNKPDQTDGVDVKVPPSTFNEQSKQYSLHLIVETCSAPSISPTSEPTFIPSFNPSFSSPPTVIASQFPTFAHSFAPTSHFSSVPTLQCFDNPLSWYDSDGLKFDCEWYSQKDNCAKYGNDYVNFGKVANQACCACSGGVTAVENNMI